jgi:beta-glucosidase/6-phospho-beta-glucosidase/beta-galactosidase
MNISGYFAWSFVDNFEWLEGYIPRFGTVHVDRESKDFKRTRKESNKWLQAFFDRAIEA